jgi:hypothetical protein
LRINWLIVGIRLEPLNRSVPRAPTSAMAKRQPRVENRFPTQNTAMANSRSRFGWPF